ncbi:SH3 domain-containing protein [Roseibium sp. RKSG952]|uniref:SH3 domain-containing protein n=1 Tax=Roseibium sp. RKSG952 TaxID=2529384 RepID=UPI0012BC1F01|nr:SH3 domain-containing protein [Roseibium sp. RKSG952]MTH96060.1 hypothetical protein [Roseibium sp. RKSG952]
MRNIRAFLAAIALGAAAIAATGNTAQAAVTSVTTANVNLRAGPSTSYPAVTTVPAGTAVATYGCTSGYGWCDVSFGTYRGWMSSSYLQTVYNGRPVVVTPAVAPAVGITVVNFNRAYWDRYYRAYPWYAQWNRYPAGAAAVRGGTVAGPNGTVARGGAIVGPAGNHVRGGAVTGPDGNTVRGGTVCGPHGCAQGAVGPNGGIWHR